MEDMICYILLMGFFGVIALFGVVVPTIDDFRKIEEPKKVKSNPRALRAEKSLPPPPVPVPPKCWRVPRTDTPKIIIQPGAIVSSEDYRRLKPMIQEFERRLPIHERS
jgi:hypothetical protein